MLAARDCLVAALCVQCKHLLATHLAVWLGCVVEKQVSNYELAQLLMAGWSRPPAR